jgi:hypothetical protein
MIILIIKMHATEMYAVGLCCAGRLNWSSSSGSTGAPPVTEKCTVHSVVRAYPTKVSPVTEWLFERSHDRARLPAACQNKQEQKDYRPEPSTAVTCAKQKVKICSKSLKT